MINGQSFKQFNRKFKMGNRFRQHDLKTAAATEHFNKKFAKLLGYEVMKLSEWMIRKGHDENESISSPVVDDRLILVKDNTARRMFVHFRPESDWNQLIECVQEIERTMGKRMNISSDISVTYSLAASFVSDIV